MDQALINQKLESSRRCVMRLEERCPDSAAALQADLDAQDILTLNLTRAIQLCVDIASHWIAEHHELTSPITKRGDSPRRFIQSISYRYR